MSHRPNPPYHLFLKIKFWHTAMSICVHIIYGYFQATTAELSSWDRSCMPPKSLKYL